MSPEEFDNRLRSAFKDEHLPPREQLWQNINGRLDKKPSLSLWHWMTPLFAVLAAGLIWLSSNLLSKNSDDNLVQKTEQVEKTAPSQSSVSTNPIENNHSIDNSNNSVSETNSVQSATNNVSESNNSNNTRTRRNHSNNQNRNPSRFTETFTNQNVQIQSGLLSDMQNNRNFGLDNNANSLNSGTDHPLTNRRRDPNGAGNPGFSENFDFSPRAASQLKTVSPFSFTDEYFKNVVVLENFQPIKIKIDKKEKIRRAIESSGDFSENKWWLNIGIGPQTNINKVLTMTDSIDYIHKDLWKIRENLSGSGLGFQFFANVQKKFGKKNQFSFETGLEFSHRKEDIKFTDYSYDLRISEKNTGKTLAYFRSLGYLYYNNDTSTFALTEGFSYVNKNTYNVVTIPVRFNYELGVSPNSFLSLGFGGGLSYINSNKVGHYNMTTQNEIITSKKYFTGSGNTRLSLYTNYNASVQLGIYGQYQMFMTPLNINNQYKIQMSDIQYGFTCRIPLERDKF